MKILLDECVDWRLARSLPQHDVKTVLQMGWSSYANGQLVTVAELEFEVFITADANMMYQQALKSRKIAVIVLRPKRSRLPEILSPCRICWQRSIRALPVRFLRCNRSSVNATQMGAQPKCVTENDGQLLSKIPNTKGLGAYSAYSRDSMNREFSPSAVDVSQKS